jgi:hypothetical protein
MRCKVIAMANLVNGGHSMTFPDELRRAATHLQAGQKALALQVLWEYLKSHPESDLGWLMLSYAISDPKQQRASVVRALKINPGNARARARLQELTQGASIPSPQKPSTERKSQPALTRKAAEEMPSPIRATSRSALDRQEAKQKPDWTTALEQEPSAIAARPPAEAMPSEPAGAGKRERPRWLIFALIGSLACVIIGVSAIVLINSLLGEGRNGPAAADLTSTMEISNTQAIEIGQSLPATWTPTSAPSITHTPEPSPTPQVTATATIPPPNPTAIAEMNFIQEQVADLRGLSIQGTVEHYLISRTYVRPILEHYYFSQEGSIESLNDDAIIMEVLGLIRPDYDLLTNILNGFTDSLGGFYFPDTKQVFVVGIRFTGIEHYIYSHEYDHALVDQHFDLASFAIYPRCEGNLDRCKAIQALIEGDAMVLMNQWLEQYASPEDYRDILRYRPPKQILPEEFPPPYASKDVELPYLRGPEFVGYLYQQGGWSSVNEAYGRPPESTEQILHPEKYLNRENPIVILDPALGELLGPSWRKVADNTLGEWMTYMVLAYAYDVEAQVEDGMALAAAQGWGGDHYQIFVNEETDETALVAHWIWDEDTDKEEFLSAMRAYLQGRYRGAKADHAGGECWQAGDQMSCLFHSGREILWFQTPDLAMMDAIYALYPTFR